MSNLIRLQNFPQSNYSQFRMKGFAEWGFWLWLEKKDKTANNKPSHMWSWKRSEASSTFWDQGETPEDRALWLQKEKAVLNVEKKLEAMPHDVPSKMFGVDSVQECE